MEPHAKSRGTAPVRAITTRPDSVFLTFDDGPDGANTERVLDVLRGARARATFFLVAERMRSQPELVLRILYDGHAVGNHSLDHRYRNFFRGQAALQAWIGATAPAFDGIESVGFRPPAGVLTPPLKRVLAGMNEPLVLWNERFYDAVWPWTEARARRSAGRLRGGSIVLLHDRQRAGRGAEFCRVLQIYIGELQRRGLKLEALSRDLCQRQWQPTSYFSETHRVSEK